MAAINELQPEALLRRCKLETFKFETTAELQSIAQIPGQSRAADAVRFGLGIQHDGYNIFALGPVGTGKQFLVEQSLRECAGSRPAPPDLCYVNNFSEPNKPSLLVLPAGVGSNLKRDLKEIVDEVSSALAAVFESEEYQARVNAIRQSVKVDERFKELHAKAKENGAAMLHTPVGVVFAPMKQGAVLTPEEFSKLSAEEQKRFATTLEELEEQLAAVLRQAPRWEREVRNQIRELNRDDAICCRTHPG